MWVPDFWRMLPEVGFGKVRSTKRDSLSSTPCNQWGTVSLSQTPGKPLGLSKTFAGVERAIGAHFYRRTSLMPVYSC